MISEKPYCTCIPFSLCLLSNILYFGLDNKESIFILVWIIKKAFSFWLSHDYCACSKDKVQESWQHFHNNFILNYSEFSMLLFYFDLWWFETLVCYKNILRFYCDQVEDIKTIHFPVIFPTIIFFLISVISINMGKFEKNLNGKLKFYNFYHNF